MGTVSQSRPFQCCTRGTSLPGQAVPTAHTSSSASAATSDRTLSTGSPPAWPEAGTGVHVRPSQCATRALGDLPLPSSARDRDRGGEIPLPPTAQTSSAVRAETETSSLLRGDGSSGGTGPGMLCQPRPSQCHAVARVCGPPVLPTIHASSADRASTARGKLG